MIQTVGLTDKRAVRLAHRQTDGWTDTQTEIQTDGWTDRKTD